jgi:hypothetical protein
MPAIPSVSITLQDNGVSAALSVPQASVQLKVGVAIGGTPNQPFATSSPTSWQTQFVGGPLCEAGGLVCQAGNVVVGVSCAISTRGSAGAVQASTPGGSTTTVTTTVDSTYGAWDQYYVKVRCTNGGTIGTAGIIVQVSLDAGRNYGPPISLGTSTTLGLGQPLNTAVSGGTGVQLNFGAGTMVAGDSWQFATIAPAWNDAGLQAAIAAFQASQYGVAGVGSAHVVGVCAAGDIAAVQTQLQAGVALYEYQRVILELRDVGPTGISGGSAWGGSAENEATWISSLATATSGTTAPRSCVNGGFYNTPSAYSNAAGGLPFYRRPLAWALAVRRTLIPIQRRAGRVKDGPLASIVVNPATDPTDGFVYHDERVNAGLNAARIASAMTWPKKGAGFFQCQEPLMSANGSQFTELVIGNVLDAACDIAYAAGVEEVSDDLLLQANGTLNTVDLNIFEGNINNALNEGLTQVGSVSSVTATIPSTANVQTTGVIPIIVVVQPRGYANSISETISLTTGA